MNKITTTYLKAQFHLRYVSLFCLLAACLATLVPVTVAAQQTAATITVGDGLDCDYTTLALAVLVASSGDTILVTNKTFFANEAVFNISNKSLTIEGGHTSCSLTSGTSGYTTLDGTGMTTDDSIIEIIDISGSMNVTLSNLKMTFGLSDDDGGGGVEISGKESATLAERIHVTFKHVFIQLNNSEDGGGVHITDGILMITDETLIESNSANDDGGGIFCQNGQITLEKDSYIGDTDIFQGNTAGGNGAGLYLDNCDLTLGSTDGLIAAFIKGNASSASGGGIYAVDSDLNLHTNTFISGNSTQYSGGGIYMSGTGGLNLKGTIELNEASRGAGIAAGNSGVNIIQSSGRISDNVAEFRGGGITLGNSHIQIGGAVKDNESESNGGGISMSDSTLTLTGSGSISSNTADGDGGGIFTSDDCTITMGANTEISGNSAKNGGGISTSLSGNPNDAHFLGIFGGQLLDNTALVQGGGIHIRDRVYGQGTVTLDDLRVSLNQAPNGAGIYYETREGGATISISNSAINDNIASDSGGGIYVESEYSTSEFSLSNTFIQGNSAVENGGGMYLSGPTEVKAQYSLVSGNSAELGGGIFMDADSPANPLGNAPKATFEKLSSINGNMARFGAGVNIRGTETRQVTFTMQNGNLSSNEGRSSGGAIWANWATVSLEGTLIANNSAPASSILVSVDSSTHIKNSIAYANPGYDIIYADSASTISILDSTLVAEVANHGIADSSVLSDVTIENTIFSGFADTFSGNATLATLCLLDSTGELGPTDSPAFVDALNHDYHLLPTSSAINKCATGSALDFDSNARPVSSGLTPYDIGAFEYQTPLTTKTLSVFVQGMGSVTSSPGSINCTDNCSEAFLTGTVVTLTPIAESGYAFDSWSGSCTGSGACVTTMDAVKSVEALFVPASGAIFKDGFE